MLRSSCTANLSRKSIFVVHFCRDCEFDNYSTKRFIIKIKMNAGIIITLIVIGGVVCGEVLSCDSCGGECKAACGTRQFRTCCFNYLRKRSTPSDLSPVDPSLRLELWLARSRAVQNVALPSSDVITPNVLKLKARDLNMAHLLSKQNHQFELNEDGNDYNIQSTM